MGDVEQAVEALRAGMPVVLPTDTVYGLCASPYSERYARVLYALKRREETKPTALLAELGFRAVRQTPDLAGRDRVVEGRWGP